jgi:tetratricopeptide (TPR) repeat protein
MAAKVNTKFVIYLSIALALLVGGVAAFYLTVVRQSTGELVAEGDRYLVLAESVEIDPTADPDTRNQTVQQKGQDYRLAAQSYGRAWQRDRGNVEVLLKYIDAYSQMTVKDQYEARNVLKNVYGLTREATEIDPGNDQLLEDFYQMLYRWGQELSAPNFFNDLYSLSTTRLETDPDNLTALKFQGISQALQLSDDMDRGEQQQALETLQRVHEARPNDTDVLHHLARWHLYDAGRSQRVSPDDPRIEQARKRVLELANLALEADPQSAQVRVEFLDVMLALASQYEVAARQAPTQEQAEAWREQRQSVFARAVTVLNDLEADLLANPEPPYYVRRTVDLIPKIAVRDGQAHRAGLDRSEALLASAADKRPDLLLYHVMLANLHKLQLELDDALDSYLEARDHPVMGNFEASLRDEALKQQAIYEVANIELIRAEAAEDPQVRDEILDDADDAVDRLAAVVDEDARVLMLRGKIAMLRNQNSRAMQAIDQAIGLMETAGGGPQLIEAYLLSARARQAEQQWGAAADRLERVLSYVGNAGRADIRTNIRLQLAEVLLQSRRLDPARQQLDLVLDTEPDNLVAQRLLAQYHAKQGDPDQAIEVLQATGLADSDPKIALALAEFHRQAGDDGRSRELVEAQWRQQPGNVSLLQALLQQVEDQARRVELLDEAESAGASSLAIDLLRRQWTDTAAEELSLDEMLERTRAQAGSPLQEAVRRARVYLRYQQMDKAREALAEAKRLDADDDDVMLLELDMAIRDEDFDRARRLATEVGRRNLDLADGHFIRGRLAAAEGKLRQALVSYDQALKQRPIFDEGWRQYGELLMRAGDPQRALDAYDTALNQRPNNLQALLGRAQALQAQGRRLQALENLRLAADLAPNNAAILGQYLALEERYGNSDTVRERREEIAASNPQNVSNRAALALLKARDGMTDRALDEVDQLIEEFGPQRELIAARASVLRTAGDTEAGEQAIRDYIQQRGAETQANDYVLLARYQLTARQVEPSLASYRRAADLETDPARPVARELADVLFNFNQTDAAIDLYRSLFDQAEGSDNRQRLGLRLTEALLRAERMDQAEAVLDDIQRDATSEALRAVLANARGDREAALRFIQRSLQENAQNAMTYFQRAALLAEDPERQRDALNDLDQALTLNPEMTQALLLQARLQLQLQQTADAIRSYRLLLEQMPANNEVRQQLATLYAQTGQADLAEDLVEEGLEIDPNNPGWLALNAQIARSRGDLDAAADHLESLVAASPSPAAVAQLALLYLEQGKAGATDALLGEHPEALNGSPSLQALRGRALHEQGRTDEAERVFTLALQRCGSVGQVGEVLGQALRAMGRDDAVALAEAAGPLQDPLWVDLTLARIDVTRGRFEDAMPRLSSLRERVPASQTRQVAEIERMHALALLQTEDYRGARDAYERLLKVEPDNVEVLNNLAFILAKHLDDPEAAVPMAEKARDLAPRSAEVLDTLGWTYYQANRIDEARAVLEQSVQLRPLPANTYHLGRVYVEMDQPRRARPLLEQAVQLAQAARDPVTAEDAEDLLRRLR